MSDLVVKFQELEDSQSALKKIMSEFEHASDHVSADDGIWSNDEVRDAMHSFADNWKDHRGKLLKKMDDSYQHSAKCLQSWLKADKTLAHSVETKHTSRGGPVTAQ